MQVKHTHIRGFNNDWRIIFYQLVQRLRRIAPGEVHTTRGSHYLPLSVHFPADLKATGSRDHDRYLYVINKIYLTRTCLYLENVYTYVNVWIHALDLGVLLCVTNRPQTTWQFSCNRRCLYAFCPPVAVYLAIRRTYRDYSILTLVILTL